MCGCFVRYGPEQSSKDPPFFPKEWDMDKSDDETSAPRQPPKPEQIYEAKFLVFDSCLRELLDRCLVCGAPECKVKLDFVGTMVRAEVSCPLSHSRTWRSQPFLNRKPMGNISVCSAILFSGSSPTKVLRLFSFMGMQSLQKTQYFEFQRCNLLPAVTEVWHFEQATLLDDLRGKRLCLAGDGRADTSGHSADFGTYTLLETSTNRVLHTELVKVRHYAISVNKKIVAVARAKKHSVLLKWIKTIIRHLHWCARTSDGDGKLVLAKWVSLLRHMINVHEHPDPLHPACEHGKISDRLWLEEGKFYTVCSGESLNTYIAALHFNHNADRDVLIDEDGNARFHEKCSKADRRWTVVPAKEAVTYDYVQKLIDAVLGCLVRWPTYAIAEKAAYRQSHDTLSSKCGMKPQLEDAIARHRSRF
ncbi:hypothetical protein HPB47_012887 [Ixodes persulcatus]|uniref:Uncharacterized protein n=1 Tax=Ixodes persulcatus TaxID=34615 RepID=A0AC60NSA9_IXOPE|nr:hypothetical protein HPB47_012887 [Ixodes persulcatus]